MLFSQLSIARYNMPWVAEDSTEYQLAQTRAELKACRALLEQTLAHNRQQDDMLRQTQEENAVLKKERHTDCLTGLLNNCFLIEEASAAMSQSQRSYDSRMMVVYCDINGLKMLNDNHGHEAGDLLLKTFGEALKQKFKRNDDQFIIRKSGDEFVLILQNCTPDYVDNAFREINDNTSFEYKGMTVNIQCGYGYTTYTGADFNTMLADADNALYENKIMRKAEGFTTSVDFPYVAAISQPEMEALS